MKENILDDIQFIENLEYNIIIAAESGSYYFITRKDLITLLIVSRNYDILLILTECNYFVVDCTRAVASNRLIDFIAKAKIYLNIEKSY